MSVVAAAAIIAVMAVPLLRGRVHLYDDLGAFHLPTRAFYAQQLKAGQPFDWTPDLFAGLYLSGEGQVGGYHPAHWLLYRWLPLPVAFELELIGGYPLMLWGAYLWLRRLVVRRDVALFGSLAFTFSSFNLLHFVHVNAVAIVAHVPWILWAVDRFLDRRGLRRPVWPLPVIALLTGSQVLLGYPQYVWFSLLAQASYAAFRTWQHIRRGHLDAPSAWRSIALPLALAGLLGAVLGGVQLLPTYDALGHSVRSTTDAEFVNSFSLHPLNLVQWVAPYLFHRRVLVESTHELGVYLGAVPLLLIVWLRCRSEALGPRRGLALAAAGFAAVMVLLALGNAGQLYRLQRWLPVVGGFRCPCRYMLLANLGAMVLAALGFLVLVRDLARGRTATWRDLRPLGFVLLLSVLVAAAGLLLRQTSWRPWMGPSRDVLLGPLLIGGGGALLALAARGHRWALPAMVAFAAIDLGSYGLSFAVTRYHAPLENYLAKAAYRPTTAADPRGAEATRDPQGFPWRVLGGENPLSMVGWARLDGYAGLEPARRLNYSSPAALRVAGVRWVQASPKTAAAGLRPWDEGWLEVPDPLPVVRMLGRSQVSHRPAHDLPQIDIARAALTEAPLDLADGPPGTVAVTLHRPGRLELALDVPTRQLLCVAQTWHPGWQARVDGQPVPLLRVNGDFLGCVVQPGARAAVLEFRPASLALGRWLSLAGLVAVAGWSAGLPFGSRRKVWVMSIRVPARSTLPAAAAPAMLPPSVAVRALP